VVRHPEELRASWTERIDRVVTHRVWGLALFLLAMAVTFQSIFSWSVPFMDALDAGCQVAGSAVAALVPAGPLRSLLVDGVIGVEPLDPPATPGDGLPVKGLSSVRGAPVAILDPDALAAAAERLFRGRAG